MSTRGRSQTLFYTSCSHNKYAEMYVWPRYDQMLRALVVGPHNETRHSHTQCIIATVSLGTVSCVSAEFCRYVEF